MQGLLDFLKRYSHLFLFALLEGAGLLLLFRFNFYQGSVWFTSANALSGAIMEWEADILSYASLGERNKALMERNIVLEKRVAALSHLLEDAGHDSTATEIRQAELLTGFDMIPAEVVDNSITRHDNYLTINKGLADGVRPEMGVVCGTGAVGIVYQASAHYAIVMPLLNSKSNVSCRLRGTGYFGYLHWEGGHPLYATLGDIPRHARIRKGMAVETRGTVRGQCGRSGKFGGRIVIRGAGEPGHGLCPLAGRVRPAVGRKSRNRQLAKGSNGPLKPPATK